MADEPKPEGAEPAAGQPETTKPAEEKPAAAKPPAAKPPAAAAHAAPKPPAPMAATPWESDLSKELKERFGDQILELSSYLGQNFLVSKPEAAIGPLASTSRYTRSM